MQRTQDILTTLRMFQEENLDVRTVTLGVNLLDCADPDTARLCRKVRDKVRRHAGELVRICEGVEHRYGIPIVNRRLAFTPLASIVAGGRREAFCQIAEELDDTVEEVGVDLAGGFSALVHKGMTTSDEALIRAIPHAMSRTERLCASINVASTAAGINVSAINLIARQIRSLAQETQERDGFGAAKLSVFANMPEDNPFMAGAMLGFG
ncbi:MAG: DUF711 family protein, partial [Planctomycetota bacterium]